MAFATSFRITQVPIAVGFFGRVILQGNSLRRMLRFQATGLGPVAITPTMDLGDPTISPIIVPQSGFIEFEFTKWGPVVTSTWYQIENITNVLTVIESFYVNSGG